MPRRNPESAQRQNSTGGLHGHAESLATRLAHRHGLHRLCASELAGAVTSVTRRECRACDDCTRRALALLERKSNDES
jgi:hypothetical protein